MEVIIIKDKVSAHIKEQAHTKTIGFANNAINLYHVQLVDSKMNIFSGTLDDCINHCKNYSLSVKTIEKSVTL